MYFSGLSEESLSWMKKLAFGIKFKLKEKGGTIKEIVVYT